MKIITGLTDRLRTWGLGCDCHAEDLKAKRKARCVWIGRRLHQVNSRVGDYLRDLLAMGNAARADDFDTDSNGFQDFTFLRRRLHYEVSLKTEWLNQLPSLFAVVSARAAA
eukprot:5997648-Pyramimonas_sp.AAC.1